MQAYHPGNFPLAIFILPDVNKFSNLGWSAFFFLVIMKPVTTHLHCSVIMNRIYFYTAFYKFSCYLSAYIIFKRLNQIFLGSA